MDKRSFIREQYDQSAGTYNTRYRSAQREKFDIGLPPMVADRLAGTIILDLGCGTGLLGEFLHELFPQMRAELISVDIAPAMIAQARRIHACECVVADLSALPVRDAVVGAAFSFTALQNLPDWHIGVTELFRALIPGGLFVASVLKTSIDPAAFFSFLTQYATLEAQIRAAHLEDCVARGQKR